MKVAIIGLGIIGSEWAKHLNDDGVLSASWNRTAAKDKPKYCADLNTLPAVAEIIHVVVSDPLAVDEILEIICPKLNTKHIVIQSSTIDPVSSGKFVKMVEAAGAKYLEAPFTGSLPAAQKRELIFYAGGKKNVLESSLPYLKRLSKSTIHIGTCRQACMLKLVMNLQISAVFEVLAEALCTARHEGITDDIFFEAFKFNASFSGVAALKEPKLRSSDFSPQFSIKHMAKDMRLLAKSLPDMKLPLLDNILQLFDSAEKLGYGDLDFSALIKLSRF